MRCGIHVSQLWPFLCRLVTFPNISSMSPPPTSAGMVLSNSMFIRVVYSVCPLPLLSSTLNKISQHLYCADCQLACLVTSDVLVIAFSKIWCYNMNTCLWNFESFCPRYLPSHPVRNVHLCTQGIC
jgi:hypothetical protein